MTRRIILAIAAATLVMSAAACGKKGDLLPPPGYEDPAGQGGR